MNTKITKLLAKLESSRLDTSAIQDKLQKEYNKVFESDKRLAKAIQDTENSNEYQTNEYGDIVSWHRCYDLAPYLSCREFLATWLADNGTQVDFDNDCLFTNQGSDNLIIQDDTRRDNGVWQNGKLVINESDYLNEDGEVDEEKRNELIEKHMEKTGHFPGVFRIDYHGNVSSVTTLKKAG